MIPLLFTLWFIRYGRRCPCDATATTTECYRTEAYGFQYGHLFFYMLLGALYPKQFWFWISIGVVWEIFEYWLSSRPDVVERLGGCLSPKQEDTPLWYRKVYAGEPKHENFIDRALGIRNSQVHTWHYSVGENLTNVVGFLVGAYLRNFFMKR